MDVVGLAVAHAPLSAVFAGRVLLEKQTHLRWTGIEAMKEINWTNKSNSYIAYVVIILWTILTFLCFYAAIERQCVMLYGLGAIVGGLLGIFLGDIRRLNKERFLK